MKYTVQFEVFVDLPIEDTRMAAEMAINRLKQTLIGYGFIDVVVIDEEGNSTREQILK